MTEGQGIDSSLLAEIGSRLERLSEARHRLARHHRILVRAATELRLGRSAKGVLAQIREQCPELLALAPAPAPVRPAGRIAISA